MSEIKLDAEEKELLESYESDEWVSVHDIEAEKHRYSEYAKAKYKKDKMIGNPNRKGFHTITPYLMVPEVDPVVAFLEQAFQAQETYRTTGGAGGTHVEVKIGDSMLMLGGGSNTVEEASPASLFLYVEDVDAIFESAIQAGAAEIIPPTDGMFGEKRGAGVKDPFGNDWYFGRHDPQ